MDTPEALELQVHRIHELLVRSHADVTWNDHIPDPDNPKQLRQIDITIRRDGKLALIECRLSRRRQDVKWVEELIGRRQSLGADEVIGVASAGFTAGAKKKAARFGVHLRDFQQLSDEEITNWGRQVALRLYYYQYSEAVVSLGFAEHSVANIDPECLGQEFRSHLVLQSIFNAAASQLDTLTLLARNDTRTVGVGVAIQPDGVVLSGEPLLEMRLKCKAHLVAQDIDSSGVYGYGDSDETRSRREATIERFACGETSIVHDADRIAIEVDLSRILLPPLSQIRYFSTASASELDYESFALAHPQNLYITKGPIQVEVYGLVSRRMSADFHREFR
jgi:hypothetical protein